MIKKIMALTMINLSKLYQSPALLIKLENVFLELIKLGLVYFKKVMNLRLKEISYLMMKNFKKN
jgi:hypothetical protein